jgi:hypothetical protein
LHGPSRNGTAATLPAPLRCARARWRAFTTPGPSSADQLAWALEIAAEHERIDAEVGMASMKWGVRVDIGGQSNRASKAFGASGVRRHISLWWSGLIDLCREFVGTRYVVADNDGTADLRA